MARAEWRVLIADDEPAARRGVRQLLAPFPEFAVVGECRNGEDVLASLDDARPDVRVPRRADARCRRLRGDPPADAGADAAGRVPHRLRRVRHSRLRGPGARLPRQAGERSPLRRDRQTAREAAAPRPRGRPGPGFVVSTARGAVVVPLRDIDWIEAADNYARIWTGGRSYLLRESLQELEARVRAAGFVRAHRQALVPIGRVRELKRTADGGLVAVLASGVEVPVSRRRRAAFAAAVRRRYDTPRRARALADRLSRAHSHRRHRRHRRALLNRPRPRSGRRGEGEPTQRESLPISSRLSSASALPRPSRAAAPRAAGPLAVVSPAPTVVRVSLSASWLICG